MEIAMDDLLDGLDTAPTVQAIGGEAHKRPTDIELLLQWAVARSGRLPWLRDGWLALTLNPYSARPRRRPIASWTLAMACAGQRLAVGSGRPAEMVPSSDAERVLVAIAGLGDPRLSEIVRVCARGRIRPDWKEGIVPQRVERAVYGRRTNGKRRGRRALVRVWLPCSPDEIRAARETYGQWHAALTALCKRLDGSMDAWQINGFAAPGAPWTTFGENTA